MRASAGGPLPSAAGWRTTPARSQPVTVPGSRVSRRRVSPRLRLERLDLDPAPRDAAARGPARRPARRTAGIALRRALASSRNLYVCRCDWRTRRWSSPRVCSCCWCSPLHRRAPGSVGRTGCRASSPGTPAKYDQVGVIKVGRRRLENVLVLEPGTSAGAAYFVPLARWIVARASGAGLVGRAPREPPRGPSVLNLGQAGPRHLDAAVRLPRLARSGPPAPSPPFAANPQRRRWVLPKRWGVGVAVEDLHRVIDCAPSWRWPFLGGHSLGGAVVDAYARLGLPQAAQAPTGSRVSSTHCRRRQLPGGQPRQGAVRAPRARVVGELSLAPRSAASRLRSRGCSA